MRHVVAVLAALVLASCSSRPDAGALRVVASPVVTPAPPTPSPTPVANVAPTRAPTARPRASATSAPVRAAARPARPPSAAAIVPPPAPAFGDLAAFAGLGAWVDVFDIPSDDDAAMNDKVRHMAAQGVRTLYFETARFNSPADIINPRTVAAAVEESHALGMRVVAWYPPDFVDVDRDVRRTLAAVNYVSPNGHRFDAVAPDIERTDVKDVAERNRRLVDYSERVRAGSPAGYALAAIVIAPTSLQANPNRWPDFPWPSISRLYDVVMPMAYWTFKRADPEYAASSTEANARECLRLGGGRPCHVIGGEAANADEAQVAAYVRKAVEGGSIGGGIYDYATTRPEVWDELRALNR